ncbi:MAG: hypothetical protein IPJ61_18080 [Tessaracoccus sp.]|uniref:hypothetical protein n=1 Tax=Tessaracoccus sp. TaxID=1971211 RepID=UPI001EC3A411|nr:hypothetical protein [Tessaracoccus sp.]MBK7822902.1 hypothetical protein [Tessaracoccus sp.]
MSKLAGLMKLASAVAVDGCVRTSASTPSRSTSQSMAAGGATSSLVCELNRLPHHEQLLRGGGVGE